MSDYGFRSSPERYGLELIGEVDFAEAYEFDIVAVWRRIADGVFLYGQDSGCSCPTPFESTGWDQLRPVVLADLRQVLDVQNAANCNGDRSHAIAALLERLHSAGAR